MIEGRSNANVFCKSCQWQQFLKVGMAEADADLLFRCHFHDLFHFRQHFAVCGHQSHAFLFRMAGATPEAIGRESWEPDHLEIRILQSDAHILGAHAEAHADPTVNLDSMGKFAAGDHVVYVTLRQIRRRRADVPMVFESDGAHAAFRSFDGDLNHILRAVHEVRKSVDMTIDGAHEQLVFNARVNSLASPGCP